MPDDFYNPLQPDKDFHSCDCVAPHDLTEFIEDQACGGKLSSSRLGLLGCNIVGWILASILVIAGVKWNLSWCGTPASVIITGLATADAGVYFASKWASPRNGERD